MKCNAAAALVWALAGLAVLAGCGGSDESSGTPPPLLGEPPAVCTGANLAGLSTVVYVRSDGSDTEGCGSTSAGACASIQQGIDACAAAGCGVLVRHGAYDLAAPLQLRNGVSVYGGCLFGGETGRSYRSIINGPADQPAVSAASITAATVFQHFVVRAGDSVSAGSASVAMAVSGSSALALNTVRLVAGRGAPGLPGADAGVAGAGQDGAVPNAPVRGGAACNGPTGGDGSGGLGGGNQITGVSGCFIDCACTNALSAPSAGNPSPGGAPGGGSGTNAGGAGCACAGRSNDTPGTGDGGLNGAAGVCSTQPGVAADSLPGSFDASGRWQPLSGGAGVTGDIGAGGGGGHAGGIAVDFVFGNPVGQGFNGGGGGGGGGGGCGGLPGSGGGQGGASIALAVDTIGTVDTSSVLVAGPGGNGGTGGQGGIGGAGGAGGATAGGNRKVCLSNAPVPSKGGAGGSGGAGGAGSGGAGGNGGPSIGLAARTGAAAALKFNASYPGTPGNGSQGGGGGAGGLGNCVAATGQGGVAGVAAATLDFSNVFASRLEPNQTLPNGGMLKSAASQLIMQSDGNLCLYTVPDGRFLWCSMAQDGGAQSLLVMQGDGNLCVVVPQPGQQPKPIWCTGTYNNPGAYLSLAADGHAGVVLGSTELWRVP